MGSHLKKLQKVGKSILMIPAAGKRVEIVGAFGVCAMRGYEHR
jgi:hypothetical protein